TRPHWPSSPTCSPPCRERWPRPPARLPRARPGADIAACGGRARCGILNDSRVFHRVFHIIPTFSTAPAGARSAESNPAGGVMARALWEGSISFGLVEIPVGLYPAEINDELSFRML